MIIVIDDDDEGLVTGKIKLVLIHQDSAVYFIAEKYHALHIPDIPHTEAEKLQLY